MVQCPKCDAPIDDEDFGLISCSQCGASIMIDIDGSSRQEVTQASSPEKVLQTPDEEGLEDKEMNDWDQAEEFDQSRAVNLGVETQGFQPLDDNLGDDGLGESAPLDSSNDDQTVVVSSPPTQDEFHDLTQAEVSHPHDGNYQTQINTSVETPPASLDQIAAYGNSTESRNGNLSYDITVFGIDTKDLRDIVKDALADRRLLLDPEGLIRSLENGTLLIEGLSSIKAHVLLDRLVSLPLEFEWRQSVHG